MISSCQFKNLINQINHKIPITRSKQKPRPSLNSHFAPMDDPSKTVCTAKATTAASQDSPPKHRSCAHPRREAGTTSTNRLRLFGTDHTLGKDGVYAYRIKKIVAAVFGEEGVLCQWPCPACFDSRVNS